MRVLWLLAFAACQPEARPTHEDAPAVYYSRCAACHGPAGKGDGPAAASLTPRPRDFGEPSWHRRDDEVLAVIRDGGAAHGKSPAMPANADLDERDLAALVTFIQSR
jgi:mono/diheme cytochrome c family protein